MCVLLHTFCLRMFNTKIGIKNNDPSGGGTSIYMVYMRESVCELSVENEE